MFIIPKKVLGTEELLRRLRQQIEKSLVNYERTAGKNKVGSDEALAINLRKDKCLVPTLNNRKLKNPMACTIDKKRSANLTLYYMV